jgi:uncharacterized protein YjbI with pentapeptide repeats
MPRKTASKSKDGLALKKPVPVLHRPLTLNFKELFKPLTKSVVHSLTGQLEDAAADASEAAYALGLGADTGEVAWTLIHRALTQAIRDLAEEQAQSGLLQEPEDRQALDQLDEKLDADLSEAKTTINRSFFENPKRLPLLEKVQPTFAAWLQGFGMHSELAASVSRRLPSYFVFALEEEWQDRANDYKQLREHFDTPFAKASEDERAWRRYSAHLQRLPDEPMFDEAFGLREVYVETPAYFIERSEGDDSGRSGRGEAERRIVVDLISELDAWVKKANPDDAVRVLSGGPGGGKSSLAKIFAAKCAERDDLRTLFVRLHWLNFSHDLSDAVGRLIADEDFLRVNPLDSRAGAERLLIIFDGLDELALSGKAGAEIARDFTREVLRTIEARNSHGKTRLQALITGRELAAQSVASDFKKPGQVLHVLPYFISPEEVKRDSSIQAHEYIDESQLLATDRRDLWWRKYGAASGKGYAGLPEALRHPRLQELTAQPLLNYLVALSYDRQAVQFSQDTTLNIVYADLLKRVYERGWEKQGNVHVENLKLKEFTRVLEEIAVSAWHGNGRTTTVADIEQRCKDAGIRQHLLEAFQTGVTEGVTRLLTAFYFRATGERSSNGDKTFEFTHKSFGEYLIALRIVRGVRWMHKQFQEHKADPEHGRDEKELLKYWGKLCAPTAIDNYIFQFVADEISLQTPDDCSAWMETLGALFGFMLRHGLPMKNIAPELSFKQQMDRSRNAEEALLAVAHLCTRTAQKPFTFDHPSPTAFGEWLGRIQGQKPYLYDQCLALRCLGRLNLSESKLLGRDLVAANLQGADLQGADLQGADLQGADLQGAFLQGAFLQGADLQRADLQGADLQRAKLQRADLQGADLQSADLQGAILYCANLYRANLYRANLQDAILEGAIWVSGKRCGRGSIGKCIEIDETEWREQQEQAMQELMTAQLATNAPSTPAT